MKIVKIYPKTNFHTFLHSDTLWGNLIYTYRMLYGIEAITKILRDFQSDNFPFKVSSSFPFVKKKTNVQNDFTYFFPKPINGVNLNDASNPEIMAYMKEYKKVKYIEKEIFEKFLSGEYDENKLFERFYKWKKAEDELKYIQDKHINNPTREEELKNLIKTHSFDFSKGFSPTYQLHNSIDRMKGSTLKADGKGQLYWEEEYNSFGNLLINFSEEINGIFFLVEGDDISLIEAPLRLLSHIGIGGNKSIGKGSFNYEIEDFSFDLSTDSNSSNSYVSLSLYNPSKGEVEHFKKEDTSLYYEITTRIGKVGRDFNLEFNEKNPVICFSEGSSFFVKEPLIGQIIPTAKFDDQNDIYSNYLFFGVRANLRLQ